MFCTNCGTKLDEGEKFCVSCGARIDEPEAVETAPQLEAPHTETPPVDVALPQETTAKDYKDILTENGLEKYIHTFEENDLTDIVIIAELTESELEQIGITSLGAKKKILHAFELKQTPQIVQPQYSQVFNSQAAKLRTYSASLYRKMRPVLHNKKIIYGGIAAAALIFTGVLIFNKAGNDSAYNSGNNFFAKNPLENTTWQKEHNYYMIDSLPFAGTIDFGEKEFEVRGNPQGYASLRLSGTYKVSGKDVEITFDAGRKIQGTIVGNSLTLGGSTFYKTTHAEIKRQEAQEQENARNRQDAQNRQLMEDYLRRLN